MSLFIRYNTYQMLHEIQKIHQGAYNKNSYSSAKLYLKLSLLKKTTFKASNVNLR